MVEVVILLDWCLKDRGVHTETRVGSATAFYTESCLLRVTFQSRIKVRVLYTRLDLIFVSQKYHARLVEKDLSCMLRKHNTLYEKESCMVGNLLQLLLLLKTDHNAKFRYSTCYGIGIDSRYVQMRDTYAPCGHWHGRTDR